MNKILKIEALRGFVALYVALAHIFTFTSLSKDSPPSFFWNYGDAGVAIFFVISGFVIHLSYSRGKNKSFKSYFFKRFLRIYIPLIFVFIATYIVLIIQGETTQPSFLNILMNLLMLQHNDAIPIFSPLFGNAPLWSLSFEWWYYMFYFFLMAYFKKKASFIVYSLCILSSILHYFYPGFVMKAVSEMSLWWFGVELAKLYMKKKETPINIKNLYQPLMVITLCAFILYFTAYNQHTYVYLSKGLVFIIIGLLWAKAKWFGFNYTIGLFLPLGDISYSLYIAHFPLVVQTTYLNNIIPNLDLLKYSIYLIFCLIFCYIIEVLLYPKIHKFLIKRILS